MSSRAKLSVSALAERKIASARPRKYGLLLRAVEEMLLYGQALARMPVDWTLSRLQAQQIFGKAAAMASANCKVQNDWCAAKFPQWSHLFGAC